MNREKKIKSEIYDLIIVGAGAAGLFAGASLSNIDSSKRFKVLLLERKSRPGRKLLTTGGGQCNLTNSENIKDFLGHYGENGPKIRTVLYKFNNLALMKFLEDKGLPLLEQVNGRVYPRSLKSHDVLDVLLNACKANGVEIKYNTLVSDISLDGDLYSVKLDSHGFLGKNVLIAGGGSSFPTTGSDGSLFPILEKLGLKIVSPRPALSPIYVENYPFASLAGISIENVAVKISKADIKKSHEYIDDLLLTHDCFSGPAILNASRFAEAGTKLSIDYMAGISKNELLEEFSKISTSSKLQLDSGFYKTLNTFKPFAKSFCDNLLSRANLDPKQRASQISKADLAILFDFICEDEFSISGTKGFKTAMATAGGLALAEIDVKTMESIKYPGLFFAGEVLDIDGDTGGYNLQFAFSSAHLAVKFIEALALLMK